MAARITIVLTAAIAIHAYAQEPAPQPLPEPRNVQTLNLQDMQRAQETAVPQPPDPPAGRGAWSLRIHTTGGFTGQGIGAVTIASNGQVACGPAPCATPVAAALLKPVNTALGAIIDAAWIHRMPSSYCRDCIQTTIALKRREGDVVRTFIATWDDSQPPAPELRELRRLAFELRATRSSQR